MKQIVNRSNRLNYSLKWISLESLTYQCILLLHQILLFKISGYKTYGAIGTIFSLVYFTVTITSFGLESSLSPFFQKLSKSRAAFRSFFLVQCIPTIVLSIIAGTLFICFKYTGLSSGLMLLIALLIFTESIKKTLRGILYLAFENKINASVEIASILTYVFSVWLLYFIKKQVTLAIIFIPMFAVSLFSSALLFFFIYQFYKQLPRTKIPLDEEISCWRVAKCRLFNFINQFGHNMFSSNFLIPFFAFQFGLTQAGIFKLLSHISYGITSLMRKIFGWTSDSLLSQAKHMTIVYKRTVFSLITQRLNHVFYALLIFSAINASKLINYSHIINSYSNWILIYLFLLITLSDNLFITYEKFYIAEEKNHINLIFNTLSIVAISIVILLAPTISQLSALCYIAVIRVIMFAIISLFSFFVWNIQPTWRVRPRYIAAYLIISIAVSFIL